MNLRTLWIVVLVVILQPAVVAQESARELIKDRTYVQIADKWYQKVSDTRVFEVMPNVVTVKFKSGVDESVKGDFLNLKGATKLRANRLGNVDITVPAGMSPVEFVQQLQKEGVLEYAEVNTYGEYLLVPDDTDFSDQWGLDNTGQTGGTADADIDAPEAWNITTGDTSVVVAVADSGVDYNHEDLECNIWVNPGEDLGGDGVVWDPVDLNGIDDDGNGFIDDLVGWHFNSGDNDPMGTFYHGTHVAGIVGACGDNAQGVIGVAGGFGPGTGANIMVLNIGDTAPNSAVLDEAIIYAADNGARVITLSLSVGSSTATDDAIDYAHDIMGVFIDAATGNDDGAVSYPATHTDVMAVGATNDDDLRAEPALGLTWGSNFGSEVEVVAPGVNILSTRLGDTYGAGGGTSYASPYVAGTAALMFSVNPGATNEEVRACITDTAEDEVGDPTEDDPGRDDFYGFGRLNTADALGCIAPFLAPVCDANGPYTAECGSLTMLDGSGSYDPNDDPFTYLWSGPFTGSPTSGVQPSVVFPAPTGDKSVSLQVWDDTDASDNCTADVAVVDTQVPDIDAPADVAAECTSPAGTPVDLGDPTVSDICDAAPAVSNDAPPLFPLGGTLVTWTATDASGNSASDDQNVTIADNTPPEAFCNAPAYIVPPDAPIAFTATATDICGNATAVVTGYDCFTYTKKGKRIDKTDSCQVAIAGDTIAILNSGGVGDNITWTVLATDEQGNSTDLNCAITVTNPAE